MKIRRLKHEFNMKLVAIEKIKQVLQDHSKSEHLPIFVYDVGYDLDARLGFKRNHGWIGYKVHLTETLRPVMLTSHTSLCIPKRLQLPR